MRPSSRHALPRPASAPAIALAALLVLLAGRAAGNESAAAAAQAEHPHFELYEVVGMLIVAAETFAVERGLAYAALNDSAPMAAEQQDALGRRRQDADGALLDVLGRLRGEGAPEVRGRDRLVTGLGMQFDELLRLRQKVDTALATRREARNGSIATVWFRQSTRLIEAAERLTHVLQREAGARGATHLRTLGIQQYVRVMAEFSGRERALLGAAIAARQPITRDDEVKLRWYRNRVDAAWRAVELWSKDADTHAALHEAFDQVRTRFFGEFQATRAAVYEAGRGDGYYPISPREWFERANRAIESIGALRKAVAALGLDSAATGPVSRKRFDLRLTPLSHG